MRVLVAHNRYRAHLPSGENRVVDLEIAALRAAGLHVATYLRSSDELDGLPLTGKLRAAVSPVRSPWAVRDVLRLVETERPDVLHLHNPYPLISLAVVAAVRDRGVAVVQTVHNHRHTCMSGSFLRDGRSCHDCVGRGPLPGVLHGCYRGSRPQSAVMAAALLTGRRAYAQIDRFVAVTPQIAASLQRSGISADRVVVKPNTVPDPGPQPVPGSGVLVVGRLSAEKGVPLIVEAWLRHPPGSLGELTLAGEGPARDLIETLVAGRPDIQLLGGVSPQEVSALMTRTALVAVPSTAAEALPLTVLEAMAHGRPVAVSRVGGLSALVGSDAGWVVEPTVDAWAAALPGLVAADAATLGRAARARYDRSYLPAVVTGRLVEVYEQAVATVRRTVPRPGGSALLT